MDILNILTIPIGVGEKGRGLHATGAKWHLIIAFFSKPQKTLLRFTFSNIC